MYLDSTEGTGGSRNSRNSLLRVDDGKTYLVHDQLCDKGMASFDLGHSILQSSFTGNTPIRCICALHLIRNVKGMRYAA